MAASIGDLLDSFNLLDKNGLPNERDLTKDYFWQSMSYQTQNLEDKILEGRNEWFMIHFFLHWLRKVFFNVLL